MSCGVLRRGWARCGSVRGDESGCWRRVGSCATARTRCETPEPSACRIGQALIIGCWAKVHAGATIDPARQDRSRCRTGRCVGGDRAFIGATGVWTGKRFGLAAKGCGAGVAGSGTAVCGAVWCGATVGGRPGAKVRHDRRDGVGGLGAGAKGRARGDGRRWRRAPGAGQPTEHHAPRERPGETTTTAADRAPASARRGPLLRPALPTQRSQCHRLRAASRPRDPGHRPARATSRVLSLPRLCRRPTAEHRADQAFPRAKAPHAFPHRVRALPCSPSGCSAVW